MQSIMAVWAGSYLTFKMLYLIVNIYIKGFSFGGTVPEDDIGPYIQVAIDQVRYGPEMV